MTWTLQNQSAKHFIIIYPVNILALPSINPGSMLDILVDPTLNTHLSTLHSSSKSIHSPPLDSSCPSLHLKAIIVSLLQILGEPHHPSSSGQPMPQCVTRPRTSDLTKRLGLKVEPISAPVSGDVTGRPSAISQ
jgi:hypothetical protein